jgi:hypothetical protein
VTNLRNANSNKTFAAAPKVQVSRCSLHNCIVIQ